eukprot:scaffold10181_cov66-Cyclotella_meneghiniana.AAC.3
MAGSLRIAAPTTPNPTNTLTDAFVTGGGVVGADQATICSKITAETAHKWANDGTEGYFTSAGKDRGQRAERPTTTTQNHTSINREAGRGMRGSETVKQMQQSAGMREKYCKKYNNYHELSWPPVIHDRHNNQPHQHSNTTMNECGW